VLVAGTVLWLLPPPAEVTAQAWQLFAIFVSSIAAVVVNAVPIFLAAVLALAVTIITGTLTAAQALSGFAEDFIVFIIAAMLVAKALIKSGLGRRIAYLTIRRFGTSTLGLAYSVVITDALIAPAFPSNTARSGVIYPIVRSLVEGNGSRVGDGTEARMGKYLMMVGIASISLSSTLWFTAMAANPVGAGLAKSFGVEIGFGGWLLAASVPTLVALVIVPWVLFKLFPPEVKETPEARPMADEALQEMGPFRAMNGSRH